MDTNERLTLFQGMVKCCHELYFWTFDADLQLLNSDCPDALLISQLYSQSDYQEAILQYGLQHKRPGLHSGDMGIMWLIEPHREDNKLQYIHILGPFAIDTISTAVIEQNLQKKKVSASIHKTLINFVRGLPVISLVRILSMPLCCIFA